MKTQRPHFPMPLPNSLQDALYDWLCRSYGLHGRWHTLRLNGAALGRLNPFWYEQIKSGLKEGIAETSDGLALTAPNWAALGARLQQLALNWRDSGLLHGWRGENFDVSDHGGRVLFELERAAFRPFGLSSRAVHLNGLSLRGGEWCFWIGRRSPHKAVDPDKLDNLAAGGISAGETPRQTVIRESFEEAGIPAALLADAVQTACLHSLRPVARGLHDEILYVFDAVLPESFTPENQDGEVAAFTPMTVPQLAEAMLGNTMMPDAQLVTLDAFRRYGLLSPQHPLAQALAAPNRNPHPAAASDTHGRPSESRPCSH